MTNEELIKALSELGLGEKEAILYEILLKNPESTIPSLQKKVSFSRTMIYYVLQSLEGMELVTTKLIGKRTVYDAVSPDKLEDFMKDREKEMEKQKTLLGGVLSNLQSIYRLSHNKPGIKFFEGTNGFKEAIFDSLTATEEILTYMDIESTDKYMRDINEEYYNKRIKKNIMKKILVTDTPFARDFFKETKSELTEIRFLPKELKNFETGMQIYNGKVGYFTTRENNLISVIIEDKDLCQMHKNIFNYLWNQVEKKVNISNNSTSTVFN